MECLGRDAYELMNPYSQAVLCKFTFEPKQAKYLTSAQIAESQAKGDGASICDVCS